MERPRHFRDIELGGLGLNFANGIFRQFTLGRGLPQLAVLTTSVLGFRYRQGGRGDAPLEPRSMFRRVL